MSQFQTAYSATVRATLRREGEWQNLSYGHHLGNGARRLAVLALEPLVEKFKTATELIEANPEYAEAKDLIQQARRVLNSAFEDLLRKSQIMGLTIFKEALKLDPWLWLNCEKEFENRLRQIKKVLSESLGRRPFTEAAAGDRSLIPNAIIAAVKGSE